MFKKILLLFTLIPFVVFSQFENRTHIIGGTNFELSTIGYKVSNSYVLGAETIFGFRLGKIFVGAGAGIQYSGNDYHSLKIQDISGNDIIVNISNTDVPLFLDVTYGKKFYLEGKLGYSLKIDNIKSASSYKTHSNTFFNSIGLGYSIPFSEKLILDFGLEAKFDYLFINVINENYNTIYLKPIAKIGLRFGKI